MQTVETNTPFATEEAAPRTGVVAPETLSVSPQRRLTVALQWCFRLLAVALCGLHGYANRHLINPDGLAYLDVATWLSTHAPGTSATPNGYWSPLYSWLLGGTLQLLHPSPYWECAVAHGLTFVLFLVSLFAFEWLLQEILRTCQNTRTLVDWSVPLPDWAILGIGYAVFIYTARRLITVSLLTPDMLVAATLYASCALLLQMRRGENGWLSPLALGVILGLGFLAKAVLFPIAFLFLGLAARSVRGKLLAMKPVAIAAIAFGVVTAVQVIPLSKTRGHLTFGESGRLNYLWYVQKVPQPAALSDLALRPGEAPQVVKVPADSGTYSLSQDPSRYYDDFRPRFDARAQLAASAKVAAFYYDLLAVRMGPFSAALFVLVAWSFFARGTTMAQWFRRALVASAEMFPLLVSGLVGFGLYLVVGHAEGRLVGPFLVLLALAILAGVQLPRVREQAARPVAGSLLAMLGLLLLGNFLFDLGNAVSSARAGEGRTANPHAQVAEVLKSSGIAPGETVGSIGFAYNAYWARLAGVKIAAEIPEQHAAWFWSADAAEQNRVLDSFVRGGVRVVVCDRLPPGASGWCRVEGTSFAFRFVK